MEYVAGDVNPKTLHHHEIGAYVAASADDPVPVAGRVQRRWEQFTWRELERLARERPRFFAALRAERTLRMNLGMLELSSREIVASLRKQKRSNALSAYQRVVDEIEYNLFDEGPSAA